jgi:four helix bundle protein
MAMIERFEDIKAWQKSRGLVKTTYRLTAKTKFNKCHGLREQIRKSALSIMSNTAEGFARRGDKESRRFLSISLGSSAEVQSRLYAALDLEYITKKEYRETYDAALEVEKISKAFMQYLDKQS